MAEILEGAEIDCQGEEIGLQAAGETTGIQPQRVQTESSG